MVRDLTCWKWREIPNCRSRDGKREGKREVRKRKKREMKNGVNFEKKERNEMRLKRSPAFPTFCQLYHFFFFVLPQNTHSFFLFSFFISSYKINYSHFHFDSYSLTTDIHTYQIKFNLCLLSISSCFYLLNVRKYRCLFHSQFYNIVFPSTHLF